MTESKANLIEIFSSAQGEGPFVGYKQIFVRFTGCNLNCNYCDTDYAAQETVNVETHPYSQVFDKIDNPVSTETLFYYLKKLDNPAGLHHSISLTGGEPLLQSDFLKVFLTENFAKHKFKIYLETNGTLCNELEKIIKLVNYVAMDIKLPSSTGKISEHWHEHKNFLKVISDNKKAGIEYFVKSVLNNDFSDYELHNIVWCMASSDAGVPLILQPDTSNPPEPLKLLHWQERLLKHINDVRIIPQTHKITSIP
jgi:organic radical activating enzyme